MIEEILKKSALKVTKNRLLLLNTIMDLKNDATIKNIIKILNNKMDKSTIYRMITKLLDKKVIDKQINCNNEDYYLIKLNHQHYIHCIKCKKSEPLDECPLDIKYINGYKIVNHSLNIDGICKECQ